MSDLKLRELEKKDPDDFNLFQLVILILSVYVLIVFAVQTMVPLSAQTTQILDGIDLVVCAFFLLDFFFRLWKAPSKIGFMKWGWIDLISSIPVLPMFYHMRLLRIIRLLRILRAFRSTKIISHYLFRHRARTGVVSVILMAFLIAIFAAIAELNLETAPDSNIKTSEDALWWSFSTITTVSCEKYPVTEAGRIIGFCLMGTITAYISTIFMHPFQTHEESEIRLVLEEMKLLRQKVEALESSTQQILTRRE